MPDPTPERTCLNRAHGEEMLSDFVFCNLWKPYLTREEAFAFAPVHYHRWHCTSPRRHQCRAGGVPQKPDPWNPSHGWFCMPMPWERQ